jgi:hypothetical protein
VSLTTGQGLQVRVLGLIQVLTDCKLFLLYHLEVRKHRLNAMQCLVSLLDFLHDLLTDYPSFWRSVV